MNIFIREMRANVKSLILWCISIVILVVYSMIEYGAMEKSGQSMNEIMKQMPKSVQSIMGVGTFDVAQISGYYGVLYVYLILMAATHAVIIGSSIISKEERDKTSEFIFVKPVSRERIITSKLTAALANIVVINAVNLISSIAMIEYYGKGYEMNKDIFKLMIGMFILQIMFLLIGTTISALIKKTKISMSLAGGILSAMFIMTIAIDINEKLEPLKYVTLFKYFEAKSLMFGGNFKFKFIMLSILITAVCTLITYIFYRKKDLNV